MANVISTIITTLCLLIMDIFEAYKEMSQEKDQFCLVGVSSSDQQQDSFVIMY